jgi:hypothetical protein
MEADPACLKIPRPRAAAWCGPLRTRPAPRALSGLRTHLGQERITLTRWMARLRRAFHTVERTQQRISRLERQLARLEG